ncbi:MAG: c-type cytochrome biogenesis protein CcmI [Panacagrimonas sp.]
MMLALMLGVAVLGAAWMTRPLWTGRTEPGMRRRAANVAAYRQRVTELDADRAAGLVDEATVAHLKNELDSRLLADAGAADAAAPAGSRRNGLLSALLGVFVLLAAVGGYVQSGSWRVQQQIAAGPGAASPDAGSVNEMVEALARKMREKPGDVNGWALLGRSYFSQGRYAESAQAYVEASRLVNQAEPDLLVNEGEALGLAQDRDLSGRPRELFEATLALAPDHGKALWYAGLAAEQAGDAGRARDYWTRLAQQELSPELRTVLDERLAQVAGALPPAPAPKTAAKPATATVLHLAVKIAPAVADRVASDATLFVFAKAASGPPMPLAVYRGKASELPREIRLDDSMAMTPAARLSSFDRWTVTARVSRSGGAQAVSGDVQGSLNLARGDIGKAPLALVIDQVVP